jgi:hypothetical protein
MAALEALELSVDPAVHEELLQWVVEMGVAPDWPSNHSWHLLDAARPYLDERALPAVEKLLAHRDTQDVVPSARAALAAIQARHSE